MPIKSDPLSSIKPFNFINCPVCGRGDFVELGQGGGIFCVECNASFSLRNTNGDPGCVVDCNIPYLGNPYRHALIEKGYIVKKEGWQGEYNEHGPAIYFYRILKEPQEDGTCTDDRGWIMASLNRVGQKEIWEHLCAPLMPAD